eukprot:GHVU01051992.1.p1 GENE.GHVU01051992.1~~GHVU01051992.1.p1  ORF type:complete len:811 (+),score=173.38 GHVU01051992.1:304-2433(+)
MGFGADETSSSSSSSLDGGDAEEGGGKIGDGEIGGRLEGGKEEEGEKEKYAEEKEEGEKEKDAEEKPRLDRRNHSAEPKRILTQRNPPAAEVEGRNVEKEEGGEFRVPSSRRGGDQLLPPPPVSSSIPADANTHCSSFATSVSSTAGHQTAEELEHCPRVAGDEWPRGFPVTRHTDAVEAPTLSEEENEAVRRGSEVAERIGSSTRSRTSQRGFGAGAAGVPRRRLLSCCRSFVQEEEEAKEREPNAERAGGGDLLLPIHSVFIVGCTAGGFVRDVTPRYTRNWSTVLRRRTQRLSSLFQQLIASTNAMMRTGTTKNKTSIDKASIEIEERRCAAGGVGTGESPRPDAHGNGRNNPGDPQQLQEQPQEQPQEGADEQEQRHQQQEHYRRFRMFDAFDELRLAQLDLAEPVPQTKAAMKHHRLYVVPSTMRKDEFLPPQSVPNFVGFCAGEPVYQRRLVRRLKTRRQWADEMRRVRDGEAPTKTVRQPTMRSQRGGGGGRGRGGSGLPRRHGRLLALNAAGRSLKASSAEAAATELATMSNAADAGMPSGAQRELFGEWQTDEVPVGVVEKGIIPVSEYGNVCLIGQRPVPVGARHISGDSELLKLVAREMGIAQCPRALVGFRYDKGEYEPQFDGVVVIDSTEADALQQEYAARQQLVELDKRVEAAADTVKLWKALFKQLLLKRHNELCQAGQPRYYSKFACGPRLRR